ncbi:MAG: deoxyribonuclease IV [Actinomycetota bacterium]|nr:deoxyribonuclease IV [Actinomycetota bacterium]
MLTIGCHLSISRGFRAIAETAASIGANTFQFFSRNPRGGAVRRMDPDDIAAFHAYTAEHGIGTVLAHAPYTLNPCSPKPKVREFARTCLSEDLLRLEATPHQLYNFHPGSHVGQGVEQGIQMIADALNEVLVPEQTTTVLLETMAGKGTEIGGTFEELRAIIDRVELSDHVGVCLDTCHVWDAGYDVADAFEGVLEHFDAVIGLERLHAVHLNDSLNPLGSHKDRHARLGEGAIGFDALVQVVRHPMLRDLPFILETPNGLPGYADEIRRVREAVSR